MIPAKIQSDDKVVTKKMISESRGQVLVEDDRIASRCNVHAAFDMRAPLLLPKVVGSLSIFLDMLALLAGSL